jgi:hypothetical protein
MASILLFLRNPNVFDEVATRVLGEAFDSVCSSSPDGVFAREKIAARIVASALKGERNPERLYAAGLHVLDAKKAH